MELGPRYKVFRSVWPRKNKKITQLYALPTREQLSCVGSAFVWVKCLFRRGRIFHAQRVSWLPGWRRYATILAGWRFGPFSGNWNNTSPPFMSAHGLPLWERWAWCFVSCVVDSKRRRHSLLVHRYPNRTPLGGALNIWIFCGQRSAGMSCAWNKVKIRSKSILHTSRKQIDDSNRWGYWAGLLQK